MKITGRSPLRVCGRYVFFRKFFFTGTVKKTGKNRWDGAAYFFAIFQIRPAAKPIAAGRNQPSPRLNRGT